MVRSARHYPAFIVAVIFLSLALSIGSTAAIGVFLPFMVQDLGWTRATISGAVALFPLVTGVLQPAVGWLLQRVPPLLVLAAGSGLLGVALLLMQYAGQPWHVLAAYGLIAGTGVAASSIVVAAALINQWFSHRHAFALGVASSGQAAGRLLLIPASGWFILTLGWRPAWSLLGFLVLAGAALALLLFLLGPRHGTGAGHRTAAEVLPTLIWWRHGSFWRLVGGFCTCGFTVHLFTAHLPSFALERGIAGTTAALALGLGSGVAALGTVGAGWLADRTGQRHLLALAYLVRAAGFTGLVFTHSPALFVAFTILTGSTFLVTGNLTVGLAGNAFGTARAPVIFGFTYLGHQIAGSLSMLLGGHSFDHYGSYAWIFAACALLLVGAAAVSYGFAERLTARRPIPLESTGAR